MAGAVVLALWLAFAEDLPPPPPPPPPPPYPPHPQHPPAGTCPDEHATLASARAPRPDTQAAAIAAVGCPRDADAERNENDKAVEVNAAAAPPVDPETAAMMWRMLASPGAWAIFSLHFLHSVGNYIALSWLPTYLEQHWGLSGQGTSLAMVPFFMVGMAGPLAAYWADAVLARELRGTDPGTVKAGRLRTRVRKRFACGGLGAAAVFAWLVYALPRTSPAAAVLVIGLSSACSFVGSAGGYEAAKLEIAAPDAAGLLQVGVGGCCCHSS